MIKIAEIASGYGERKVLQDFSLELSDADFCAIMGPNGSGKSTLVRTIAKLQPIQAGFIMIDDKSLNQFKPNELARKIAFVPQREDIVFDFSVFDTVMMGRHPYQNRWENSNLSDKELVNNILDITHLQHLRKRMLSQLSGGELRRTMIARAIAQQTPIMLLDEPLANLDIIHQYEIMDILAELNQQKNVTIVVVLHDFPFAIQYAKRTLLMKDGKIMHFGNTSDVLTSENVRQCFDLGADYEYYESGLIEKRNYMRSATPSYPTENMNR